MSDIDYKRYICDACGFIYDEAKGDEDSGLVAGTRYEDIPEDWECPLCGLTKSDLRLLPEVAAIPRDNPRDNQRKPVTRSSAKSSTRSSKSKVNKGGKDTIVIIGAGIAGWSTAEAIRRRDPNKPILLVTACKGYVYPKPAISLAISQKKTVEDLIQMDAKSKAEELNIDVRTETRIMKVDSKRKRLTTVKGAIEYEKLILALGAEQRHLPVEGDANESILRVNNLNTFNTLREKLNADVSHVTILGAGLIGCEFADDFTKAGYQVTVIDPKDQPLSRLVPEAIGADLKQNLLTNGVEWRLGVTLSSLTNSQTKNDKSLNKNQNYLATLSDESTLKTDLVLSAAGLIPNIKLAEKLGLETDRGICVNADMKTSDEDVYAIGDCASLNGEVFAYIEPIRRQAEAIAADVTGFHERFAPLPPLVKVKTPSLPLSICRPSDANDMEWTVISKDSEGGHFELREGENLLGFALSGKQASTAGTILKQLSN